MTDEWRIGKNLEEIGHAITDVLTSAFALRELKASVSISGVPAEIRTAHLPNTSLESCF
jgi:hypothetical protein